MDVGSERICSSQKLKQVGGPTSVRCDGWGGDAGGTQVEEARKVRVWVDVRFTHREDRATSD